MGNDITREIVNNMKISLKTLFFYMSNNSVLNWINDTTYLKIAYWIKLRKKLDLNNPESFNEKLQWLKINDRNPKYSELVDKYSVKQIVGDKIGLDYIIPTLGVWDDVDDINFDALPNSFVLKCTHNSGGVIVCKDKGNVDINTIKKKLNKWMKHNFYWSGREYPYKSIKPKIIAEEYIVDEEQNELKDYKFFCFNGAIKFFKIDFDRFIKHGANYYDANTNELLPFYEDICPADFEKHIAFPDNLEEMKEIARKLCQGYKFIRVDLYSANGKIYFGELTFYPASGLGKISPDGYDEMIGRYLELN